MTAILQELKAYSKRVVRRRFLIEGLPDGIKSLDPHLQIFENYIEDTALRFRKIRFPGTSERVFLIERTLRNDGPGEVIQLSDTEYGSFKAVMRRELRLNRYRHETLAPNGFVDVYLGALSGLYIKTLEFRGVEEAGEYKPDFPVLADITDERFFDGSALADVDFEIVRRFIEQKKAAT